MQRPADRGSMLIEVVFLMVLVMLPLFYLVGTLGRLQAGAYAASATAREAGRAYVTADAGSSAAARGRAAADLVLASHGFSAGQAEVSVSCASAPCLTPGSSVEVSSVVQVELPLVPDFMSAAVPTSVSLSSRHTEPVDAFRAPGPP
ncbi:MAG: pilus assembly protein [Ornithinimicrobium sp.]